MAEPRFQTLRERLRAVGISKRNARRAAAEIEDHFMQLVGEAEARGESEPDARRHAHEVLGSDQILIKHYASRPELLAWSSRWPALWFTAVPLGCYLALSAAVMTLLVLVLDQMHGYLLAVSVAPRLSHFIDLAAGLLFLGLFPASTAAAFGVWAKRRRMPLRWPLIGVAAVSIFASLINVDVMVTGGASPGYAGAGIGFSMNSLLAPISRALAVGALGSAPIWVGIRGRKRDRDREMI
jgi:hypothetical protein